MNKLDQAAEDYFNKTAKDLSKLLTEFSPSEPPNNPKIKTSSSYKNYPVMDLTGLNIVITDLKSHDEEGNLFYKYKTSDQGLIGFRDEPLVKFKKFTDSLIKKPNWLSEWVSIKVIPDICLDWMVKYHTGKIEEEFISFLDNWVKENCGSYYVYFIINNLEIEVPFHLGNIIIAFYNEEDFQKVLESCEKKLPKNEVESLKKKYVGNVIALCSIREAEPQKAIEFAFEMCSLSIDVLKLFTSVVEKPSRTVAFDFDSKRPEFENKQEILIIETSIDGQQLIRPYHNTLQTKAKKNTILEVNIEIMKNDGIGFFHNFLTTKDNSEIHQIIERSITFFASTLSQPDQHKRIVDIFTIMESICLRSYNENILDCLTKYIPKIITKKPEDRIEIQKLIKSMYDIRSKVVHHGQKKEFLESDLVLLQKCLRYLLINLIILSEKHSNKNSIFGEIDDAINSAY